MRLHTLFSYGCVRISLIAAAAAFSLYSSLLLIFVQYGEWNRKNRSSVLAVEQEGRHTGV